ncbi:amidohydrolase [Clostridiaceae bacterium HFYG-1003]|nr:amidohydrolase [Clostridiaceae bacterium HFYG-1003]
MTRKISQDVLQIEPELIEWRRHFHQYPELSFQEEETSAYIEEKLRGFGGIVVSRPTPTSVMGVITGKKPGRTIALRADIDALPIEEVNELPYASIRKGVMHACGHDGHAAILLGTARLLSALSDQLNGEVRLLFQHAEEVPPGGAVEMVKAGVMDGVDEVYGLHLSSAYDTCTFGLRTGPLTAATDRFDITIRGKGGHSAFPEGTVDPVVIGSHVIVALQSIVSRQTAAIDMVVLSACQLSAGQAYNIIPETMEITGSTRSFRPQIRQALPEKIEQIVKGITQSFGAGYDFTYSLGYAPVINDAGLMEQVEQIIADTFGPESFTYIDPVMPGEDFSAFQAECPGAFLELGTRNSEQGADRPHHNPNYKMDEAALAYGVELFVALVKNRLASERQAD